jgi:hypothetical protein
MRWEFPGRRSAGTGLVLLAALQIQLVSGGALRAQAGGVDNPGYELAPAEVTPIAAAPAPGWLAGSHRQAVPGSNTDTGGSVTREI